MVNAPSAPIRIPFTKRDLVVVLKDGSTNEQEVLMESGTLIWDEGSQAGPDTPMSLRLDFVFTDLSSEGYRTLDGWCARPAGSWEAYNLVSSLGPGRDWRFNVDVTFFGDKRGGVEDITLRFYHWKPKLSVRVGELLIASASGTCKATQPERL